MPDPEAPTLLPPAPETTPWSEAFASGHRDTPRKPIWRLVQEHLQGQIQALDPGQSLPSYAELATTLGCSLAPVKHAMRELAAQGWISLRRGRPARVLWTGSFRGSARRAGRQLITRTFHTAYRPLDPTEAAIGDDLGLDQDRFCIVCGRVRVIDGYPAAISLAYINPVFFSDPASFFLDHDVVAGSLRDVYSSLGVRPLRIPAMLKPALADEQERLLLGVAPCTPVLRAYQQTLVEWHGDAYVLEVMKGTYTDAVDYRVDRLTDWSALELSA